MATLPENPDNYPPGITQLELTDLVKGGVDGPSNKPLLELANRTANLNKTKAPLSHGHPATDIGGLATVLAGKANTIHSHDIDTVPTLAELSNRGASTNVNFNDCITAGNYYVSSKSPASQNGPVGEDILQATLAVYTNGHSLMQVLFNAGVGACKIFVRFGAAPTKLFEPWLKVG